MKKLLIVALALFALQVTAQDQKGKKKEHKKELRQEKMERFKDMNPKDMAKLQTKKMTLDLDLTAEQQAKVEKLNIKNAELRKADMEKRKALKDANKKPSQEEKLKMANQKLDQQIATKREMKKILTETQYEKYSRMFQAKKRKGSKDKMKQRTGKKRQHKKKTMKQ